MPSPSRVPTELRYTTLAEDVQDPVTEPSDRAQRATTLERFAGVRLGASVAVTGSLAIRAESMLPLHGYPLFGKGGPA